MKDFIHNQIARVRNPQLFTSTNPQHFMKKPATIAAGYQINGGDLGGA
jgi:hypothetical protein